MTSAQDALHPSPAEALSAWSARVRAEREQVERLREIDDPQDFYAPVASLFKADPRREDDPLLDIVCALAGPADTWLDIGAGGGRFVLPIALRTKRVIAVEPSEGMRTVLREAMAEYDVHNVDIVAERWPCDPLPAADVALISHVGNDIEEIGPFLDAMEATASRLCVAVNWVRSPRAAVDALWEPIHGERRITLPALPELISLLLARGRLFEVRLAQRPPFSATDREGARRFARRQLWTREGSDKDRHLQRILDTSLTEHDGEWSLSWEPAVIGVVTWAPPGSGEASCRARAASGGAHLDLRRHAVLLTQPHFRYVTPFESGKEFVL